MSDTGTVEIDAQTPNEGNDAPVRRDSRGIPIGYVPGTNTWQPKDSQTKLGAEEEISGDGLDELEFDGSQLPFISSKLSTKPTRLRLVRRLPVPPDAKIPPIWRLEVEDAHGSHFILDVTSKRLASGIGALPDRRGWFEVERHGKGTSTNYVVRPVSS